jgi:hypothetical protein
MAARSGRLQCTCPGEDGGQHWSASVYAFFIDLAMQKNSHVTIVTPLTINSACTHAAPLSK